MEHVKPWMIDNILKDLDTVLRWRASGENLQHNEHTFEGGLHFEDDSGNLRITPSRQGQVTRISKFPSKEKPIRAVLSDSEARINVTLEIAATNEYLEKQHREIHTENLGALLQLLDYDIVATSLAPRASQLVLIVKKFEVLGAGGNGTVGSIPRPIEGLVPVKELLAKLAQQTDKKNGSTSKGPSTAHSSPISSTIHSPASGGKRNNAMRTNGDLSIWASQVPMGDSRSFGLSHTSMFSFLKGQPIPNGNRGFTREAVHSNDDDLKAALWKKKGPTADPSRDNHRTLDSVSGNKASHTAAQDSSDERFHNVQSSTRPSAESVPVNATQSSISDAMRVDDVFTEPISPFPGRVGDEDESLDNGNISSKDHAREMKDIATLPVSQRPRSGKITMRDIKMPKDQDHLLEQPHSWIPTEPGQVPVKANVPLPILKMLNARAERRAKRPRQSKILATKEFDQRQLVDVRPSPDSSDAGSEEEDDIPWPPSPTRFRNDLTNLPPDSPPLRSSNRSISLAESPDEDREETPPSPLQDTPGWQTSVINPNTPGAISHGGQEAGADVESAMVDDAVFEETAGLSPSSVSSSSEVEEDANLPSASHHTVDLPLPGRNQRSDAILPQKVQPSNQCSTHVTTQEPYPTLDLEMKGSLSDAGAENQHKLDKTHVPSTAPDTSIPYTQVKRTPYINGHAQKRTTEDNDFELGDFASGPKASPGLYVPSLIDEYVENTAPTHGDDMIEASGKILVNEDLVRKDRFASITATGSKPSDELHLPSQTADLKRKHNSSSANTLPQKRLKFSDWLPENSTQEEEQLVSPAELADENRREFFKRRSSAGSAQASTPVSPAVSHKIKFATYQALSPMRHNRSSFSGPFNEAKTPSRLRESSLRLDTKQPAAQSTPINVIAPVSPNLEVEDVRGGAQANEAIEMDLATDDVASDARDPSPKLIALDNAEAKFHTDEGREVYEMTSDQPDEETAIPLSPLANTSFVTLDSSLSNEPHQAKHDRTEAPAQDTTDCKVNEILTRRSPSPVVQHEPSSAHQINDAICQSPFSKPVGLYDRFTGAYPEYKGNEKHFHSLCTKLARLLQSGSIIPLSLLDDFIIRHKGEYLFYVQRCADEGEDADPYDKYYAENVDVPLFTKKILSRHQLLIELGDEQTPIQRRPRIETGSREELKGIQQAEATTKLSDEQTSVQARKTMANVNKEELKGTEQIQTPSPPVSSHSESQGPVSSMKRMTPETLRAASPEIPMGPASSFSRPRKLNRTSTQSKTPVFVDLTLDDGPDRPTEARTPPTRPKLQELPKNRRSLPWSTAPGPLQPPGPRSSDIAVKSSPAKNRHSAHHPTAAASVMIPNDHPSSRKKAVISEAVDRRSGRDEAPHLDPFTPYNTWRRHMDHVTPGKGNSFASEEDKRRGKAIQKARLSIRLSKVDS